MQEQCGEEENVTISNKIVAVAPDTLLRWHFLAMLHTILYVLPPSDQVVRGGNVIVNWNLVAGSTSSYGWNKTNKIGNRTVSLQFYTKWQSWS